MPHVSSNVLDLVVRLLRRLDPALLRTMNIETPRILSLHRRKELAIRPRSRERSTEDVKNVISPNLIDRRLDSSPFYEREIHEFHPLSVTHTPFCNNHMDMAVLQQGSREVMQNSHRTRHDILASIHFHDLTYGIIRRLFEHLLSFWATMEQFP